MMRAIIQPRTRTRRMEEEAEKIRIKYNPRSSRDLERVAKEEYGVLEVTRTPLVLASTVINRDNGLYIFYNFTFKPYGPLALAHEIGHITAGHQSGQRVPSFFTREFEADYFSQLINNVSPAKFYAWLAVDSALMLKQLVTPPFSKEKEVERLQQLGVYHVLQ